MYPKVPSVPRFTHPLNVLILLFVGEVAYVREKYADALFRNRTERLMGLGTPGTGQLLFRIAAACSLSFHTPDAAC
jgi:hypothetical protein